MAKATDINPDSFKASIRSMNVSKEFLETKVRLSNTTGTRTLHYISDVRATRYDPVTKTLTLSMSDEGREPIPSMVSKIPEFKVLEAGSEAEITVKIPSRIIKFSKTAPPGTIAFEKHELSDAKDLVVEVAWSDVPYYTDTRKKRTEEKKLPAARWEKYKAVTGRYKMNQGEGKE